MKRILYASVILAAVLLAGCGRPRPSVFPPDVQIQELHLADHGQWQITLRLQNNSYTGMRFQTLSLAMRVDGHVAGTLTASPALEVPQFAADVVQVQLTPAPKAAAALAAIANKGSSASVDYRLTGTVHARADDEDKPREFKVHHHDWLSPVPGIADTFR